MRDSLLLVVHRNTREGQDMSLLTDETIDMACTSERLAVSDAAFDEFIVAVKHGVDSSAEAKSWTAEQKKLSHELIDFWTGEHWAIMPGSPQERGPLTGVVRLKLVQAYGQFGRDGKIISPESMIAMFTNWFKDLDRNLNGNGCLTQHPTVPRCVLDRIIAASPT